MGKSLFIIFKEESYLRYKLLFILGFALAKPVNACNWRNFAKSMWFVRLFSTIGFENSS